MAAGLSTEFQTPVVMALMGDDAESGVYAVFEEGERKFRMKRWYQIVNLSEDGFKEFVEREGDEWATARGYVPDPTNLIDTEFWSFHDANEFTLKLGIDTSDRSFEMTNVLLLKAASPVR